jgi:hypothetical protein
MSDRPYDMATSAHPDAQRLFDDIQSVCMGNPSGVVLTALMSCLAATLVVVSLSRAEAGRVIDQLPADLKRLVDAYWDDVKRQFAEAHDAGHA